MTFTQNKCFWPNYCIPHFVKINSQKQIELLLFIMICSTVIPSSCHLFFPLHRLFWFVEPSNNIMSRMEPSGLYRSDGKRPDGVSIVPWKCGQLLVWDEKCPDTFAPSYSTIAAHKLEQLLNRQKKGRCRSIKTLTHATFSLQWQ